MWLLYASLGLSWLVIAALAVCVLALARQVGVLHERVAPVGALSTANGPAVGEVSPRLTVATLDGAELTIGARRPSGRLALLLFVSPSCPICKVVIPVACAFARSERIDIVFIGDGPGEELRELVARFHLEDLPFVNSPAVGLTYQVGKLPYAVLLNPEGVIVAKGLVNSREHLESLVVAHEIGTASIQDYLVHTKRVSAPIG